MSREDEGLPPLDPTTMDNAVGIATLVLFFFFFFDMVLQFCIQGRGYMTKSLTRFILDLLATVLLLPSSYYVDGLILELCVAIAGGDLNIAQSIVNNIEQGTVARLSRVARLASRLTRTIKAVSAIQRGLMSVVVRKQNQGVLWTFLAKIFGVMDEAARELEAAERAREQQAHQAERAKR